MADQIAKDNPRQPSSEGSVKETIESILVAFILAFIFRAFVVEAFVIPTGSMGPTLMGAHFRFTCPDCGYHFEQNVNSNGPDDTDIPPYAPRVKDAICPNCGFVIRRTQLIQTGDSRGDLEGQPNPNDWSPVYFGDRILVLKYRYLFQTPQPWDVVVFKSPFEKKRDPTDPKYADNYIKRLIARPGERAMILDGDIYIGAAGMAPEQFKIRRKTASAQSALWRDVFDNDYLPHGLDRGEFAAPWQEPWLAEDGAGWKGPRNAGDANRIFAFDNLQGESAIRFDSLANHGFDVANHGFDALTDWLAYDQDGTNTPVSDLKLSCDYRRIVGDGPLTMQLTKRDDCFTVQFLPGKVVLQRNKLASADPLRLGPAMWEKPMEAQVPELGRTKGPARIEFSNVDYRVCVRVNDREVLATSDADYEPDVATLYREALRAHYDGRQSLSPRPIVRVVAARQSCSIEHLRLAKDVYYLNYGSHYLPSGHPSGEPFFGSPENIMNLGPDEYFVMGDNSPVSLDARFWGAPVDLPREGNYHVPPGRVPGRFLLGKAFFVYWPAGYRPPSLPYGIEPDFGDMRFIR